MSSHHRFPRTIKLLTNVARDVAVDLRVLGVYGDSYRWRCISNCDFFRAHRGVFEQIFRYSDPCGATHRSPRTVKLLSHVARNVAADLCVFGVYCDSY